MGKQIFIAGGISEFDIQTASKQARMYDLTTNTWTKLPDMNIPRFDPAGACIDGKVRDDMT